MTALIIDGKAVAATLRLAVAARVATLNFKPGLTVVLVGDDPASRVYVRNKDRAATQVGIAAHTILLPTETSEATLLAQIGALNADPSVDGILVQLPLPPHIRTHAILDAIDPAKDVDGLTPISAGRLLAGRPTLEPCTPRGVMHLLAHAATKIAGARALVLGRSVLVGKPMAALLTNANATVTLAHSHTINLPEECQRADILIAAIGRPNMVQATWIKPNATIIDVGINRLPNGTLTGDVNYPDCLPIARAITPVPGGVGPMTIACLLENTVTAALARRGVG